MLIELVVQHHFLELEQPITLEELKSRISAVVPFENLRYRDDEGDEVNLSSELEWKEACSLGQNHLLEVIVTPEKTTPPQPKEETPVTTENVPTTENLTLHPGISCSSCSLPVVGIRYKCSICHHYDLCETCEGLGIHQEHPFIKARKPLPENFQNVHTVTSSLHSVTQGLNQAQKTVNEGFHTAQESFNKAINQPQVQNVLTQVQEQLNKAQDQVNKFLSQPQVVAAKQQVLDTWTVFKEEAKTQMTVLAEKIQEKTTELQAEVKARLEKEQQQRASSQQQQSQPQQPSQSPTTTPSYIPQNSVPAPYPPVPSRQRYSQQLATLKELNLGQSDSQLLSLLERHNGNLQNCVDELLSS